MKQTFIYEPCFVNILDMTNDKERRESGFVKGVANGMHFQAKVYDEPSDFGINNGRVSKFSLCSSPFWDHKSCVLNYDRGWDSEDGAMPDVTDEQDAAYTGLIKYLEALPKVFVS